VEQALADLATRRDDHVQVQPSELSESPAVREMENRLREYALR
jgi:hypothetical protein